MNEAHAAQAGRSCRITGCLGPAVSCAAGMSDKTIDDLTGIPGNALGAYLNGAQHHGQRQRAGRRGRYDERGADRRAREYRRRGGLCHARAEKSLSAGNAGYRAGIHMKAYREKKPVLVIGGRAGSFLGRVSGGRADPCAWVFTRTDGPLSGTFPAPVCTGARWCCAATYRPSSSRSRRPMHPAAEEDLREIRPLVERYCEAVRPRCAGADGRAVHGGDPRGGSNPYRQMYVAN